MMRVLPQRVSGPDDLAVGLPAAKMHLRQDSNDEDGLIEDLIRAATEYLDGYSGILGRCILPQVWRQDFAAFSPEMGLSITPIRSVVSVKYRDASGDMQAVEGARLVNLASGTVIRPASGQVWPSGAVGDDDAVQITVEAGYEITPAPIKQAVLLLVGHWYANRETVVTGTIATSLPFAVERLIAPYRRPPV